MLRGPRNPGAAAVALDRTHGCPPHIGHSDREDWTGKAAALA